MELRKDYVLDRWVVISEGRGKRPKEFKTEDKQESSSVCYFCPGNEHLTPPEIYRHVKKGEKDGKWDIRVFPNKFPAVSMEGTDEIRTDNEFFTFSNAFGQHDVIVETPEHEKQLHDLSENEIFEVLKVYNMRINELSKAKGSKYVVLFKNYGKDAGTSLVHSHTQVLSINAVPSLIREENETAKKFPECPYCKIIATEKNSDRKCFENNDFAAFTPYASRFNYEIWLFPKKHFKNMTELNDPQLKNLAEIFTKILGKMKEANFSYNYFLHYSPDGENLHFHFEFTPRVATWAGFEISTDAVINSVPPEEAAKFYRGEL